MEAFEFYAECVCGDKLRAGGSGGAVYTAVSIWIRVHIHHAKRSREASDERA